MSTQNLGKVLIKEVFETNRELNKVKGIESTNLINVRKSLKVHEYKERASFSVPQLDDGLNLFPLPPLLFMMEFS